MDSRADQTGDAIEVELDDQPAEPEASPTTNPIKVDAFAGSKLWSAFGKTVGTHLDELRALLTLLFEKLPD